jgi:hypothetical protein
MKVGYFPASWSVVTCGFTRFTGADTARWRGLSIAARSRERNSPVSTVTPSWAGIGLSEDGEGDTVASRAGRLIWRSTSVTNPSSASDE